MIWFFFIADIFKTEKRDEVVYYDTYESMEAMLEKEDMATSVHLQKEELQKLQQKIRQLEARRGRISAKKAYLRNKKVLFNCLFFFFYIISKFNKTSKGSLQIQIVQNSCGLRS